MFDFFIFRSRFEQRRASGVNDRRFAVQSFDYDSREEFMRFEFSCFWITPLGMHERPSTILCRCPIDGDSTEVESRVKANDESHRGTPELTAKIPYAF
jgi:hypothetical protein